NVRPDGGGRLPDDQLEQLVWTWGRGSRLGQADQEVQLPGCEAGVGNPGRHLHARHVTSRLHARSRVDNTMNDLMASVAVTGWLFGLRALLLGGKVSSIHSGQWREHFAGVDMPVPVLGGGTVTGIN